MAVYPTLPLSKRIQTIQRLISQIESGQYEYEELTTMLPALKDTLATLELLMYGD